MVWILQNLYKDQKGQVVGDRSRSRSFPIRAGVRQGCVLSPRLFCSVLQWALQVWRNRVHDSGFDLGDNMPNLIDLRYADDILLFATSAAEAVDVLDKLVFELANVGLILNESKLVVLTTEAQPLPCIRSAAGITLNVISRDSAHN